MRRGLCLVQGRGAPSPLHATPCNQRETDCVTTIVGLTCSPTTRPECQAGRPFAGGAPPRTESWGAIMGQPARVVEARKAIGAESHWLLPCAFLHGTGCPEANHRTGSPSREDRDCRADRVHAAVASDWAAWQPRPPQPAGLGQGQSLRDRILHVGFAGDRASRFRRGPLPGAALPAVGQQKGICAIGGGGACEPRRGRTDSRRKPLAIASGGARMHPVGQQADGAF